MSLVLQKSSQAKTRVDLNGKRVRSKHGIVSLGGIQTLNAWVLAGLRNNRFILESVQEISCGLKRWARTVQPEYYLPLLDAYLGT